MRPPYVYPMATRCENECASSESKSDMFEEVSQNVRREDNVTENIKVL